MEQRCYDDDGFLPEPKNQEEVDFIYTLIDRYDLLPLGMSREQSWVWDSDGAPVTWTKWYEGKETSDESVIVTKDDWYGLPKDTDLREFSDVKLVCERLPGMCVQNSQSIIL